MILLKYMDRFKKFLALELKDKKLIIEVFLLTGIFRLIILYVPFNKIKSYIGDLNTETNYYENQESYIEAAKVSRVIRMVYNKTPWQSKCLVQSLTAQYLLSKRHINTTLYLGVSKESIINSNRSINKNTLNNKLDKLIAHSWIRCGKYIVTGGNVLNYAVVAKFSKTYNNYAK